MLLVSPADAERLAFASAFATLSIAVRGPDAPVTTTAFGVPATTRNWNTMTAIGKALEQMEISERR